MKLSRKIISSVFLAFVALTASFAQVDKVATTDNVTAIVMHGNHASESINMHNTVEKVARHCANYVHAGVVDAKACAADSTTVFYREITPNLLTNAGKDKIAAQLSSAGTAASATAVCKWIALTNTAITPAVGDTTLSGEIATNGLSRAAAATLTHTNGTSTFVIANVFTATGTQASQAAAVFDATSTGNMCFENTYTAVTLNNTDTLTVTWTVTLS